MGSLAKLTSFCLGMKMNAPTHHHIFMHLILGVLLRILGLPHRRRILPPCRLPRRRKKMKMKSSRCALGMLPPGLCYLPDHLRILPHRPPLPLGLDHPKLALHHIRITRMVPRSTIGEPPPAAPSCARPVQTRSSSLSRSLHPLS